MATVIVNFDNQRQTLDLGECLSIYSEIVGKIKGKIAEFKRKECADFKDECKQLIAHINEEKEKLKKCDTKSFPYFNLDVNEDIKRFYGICNANTDSNYILPQCKNLTELKDDTQISYERNQDSVKSVKEPKGNTGEGISQLNEKDSQKINSETIAARSDEHNSQPINDHLSVDKDVAVFSTTEYRAPETSISGKPGDRSSPLIATDRADDFMISLSSVGTDSVGDTTVSSDHTPSVKSNAGNASPSEPEVTKAANNEPSDSKVADNAVSVVKSKQGKAPCSNNPCNNESCRVFSGGTSCSEEIQDNQVSSTSVPNSAKLQRVNSTQGEAGTGQERADLGSQVQTEKAQKMKNSIKNFTQIWYMIHTCNHHKIREVMKSQHIVHIMEIRKHLEVNII
ncbi:CYIR protein [Plasmodium cynomolgi strain B]|uniref:CYIR protein n=1 Tax=Plasmodium cynomolgi (strain B) TaxID=1120755 RepID=K6V0D3_PLACD|nr:CYIR protein [Plasmodium cynomolgi strain B]GAB69764.1 CYIR protein [Plasmodium cynomolgi strain B]